MMLIGTLFEVVGIGLVVPILVIMTQPNFIERYPMVQPWWEMLGRPSHVDLIVMGMGTLVAPLDRHCMGFPDLWYWLGFVVGVLRTRLGWLVVLGPR